MSREKNGMRLRRISEEEVGTDQTGQGTVGTDQPGQGKVGPDVTGMRHSNTSDSFEALRYPLSRGVPDEGNAWDDTNK